uniref:MAGE domain-containing protein n=1 Tax=Myotis myotis TaxID=51298 RepID=A0A7J7VI35_MYOMY|nr:hypothetical protein mMyoMyo1_008329 [Myotis myotis]
MLVSPIPLSFCLSFFTITATSSSRSDEDSGSQEEEDSTSQAGPGPKNVPMDALDRSVSVNFIKEPISEADMLKAVTRKYKDHFAEVFLRACELMEMIFGLDVKGVNPTIHYYGLLIKTGLTSEGMLHGEKGVPKIAS